MFPTSPFDLSWLGACLPVPTGAANPQGVSSKHNSPVHFQIKPTTDSSSQSLADAYQRLALTTFQRVQELGARPITIPPVYAYRQSSNGKFELQATAWDLMIDRRVQAQLRLVQIDGVRSHIINAWIFPSDPVSCPVFAAELIGVSEVTRVAFLDIQVPAMECESAAEVAAVTSPIATRFVSLPCDEAAPEWATCQSSGHFTYARGADSRHLSSICDCYLAYLDGYLSLTQGIASQSQPRDRQGALEQLHAYQLHHMEHSPGKKFLSNLFEAAWTDSFMREFLFEQPHLEQF